MRFLDDEIRAIMRMYDGENDGEDGEDGEFDGEFDGEDGEFVFEFPDLCVPIPIAKCVE